METILERAHVIEKELVALRRKLHRVPELDRELPKTQALVLGALDGLNLEVTVGERLSSVTAVLRGSGQDGTGPVVLLRSDMDALPVREQTGVSFTSEDEGRMHACGHDLHMAALVGAARLLHDERDKLPGDVVLMFQPAEETSAGALAMIEEGVLDIAGTEDFSYVLARVPGACMSISACAAEAPTTAPDNHSAHAVFDESVLPDCAAFLAEVATRRLRAGGKPERNDILRAAQR